MSRRSIFRGVNTFATRRQEAQQQRKRCGPTDPCGSGSAELSQLKWLMKLQRGMAARSVTLTPRQTLKQHLKRRVFFPCLDVSVLHKSEFSWASFNMPVSSDCLVVTMKRTKKKDKCNCFWHLCIPTDLVENVGKTTRGVHKQHSYSPQF